MKVFTAIFWIEDGTVPQRGPAIQHQGLFWLIAGWIAYPTKGYSKPHRMIALDPFQLQRLPAAAGTGDAATGVPIPKGLFENPIPSPLAGKFPVLEAPDIRIPDRDIPRLH
jgi:hypothetical protein